MTAFSRFCAFALAGVMSFAVLGWMFIRLAFSLEGSSPGPITVAMMCIAGFLLLFPVGAVAIPISDRLPFAIDHHVAGTIVFALNGVFWASTAFFLIRHFRRGKHKKKDAGQCQTAPP